MKVNYVTNSAETSGVGLRAAKIANELREQENIELKVTKMDGENPSFKKWPGFLGSKSVNWIRQGRQLELDGDAILHLTSQNLSFLAKQHSPSVVTVHDIIEITEPQNNKAAMLNKYLYSGINQAEHIICVSDFTKKSVQDRYNIPSDKISVINNGVSPDFHEIHDFEQTIAYQELKKELKIPDQVKIILYVGSEHPRKNLPAALKAISKVKESKQVIFLKVGSPGFAAGREETLEVMDQLKMREQVRFIENVAVEKLNYLYNLADVLVYPSKFEGFGLPPLQAMAAGLPVVCSNATSLLEVVGDNEKYGDQAAITHHPDDEGKITSSILEVLSADKKARALSASGIVRSRSFSWETAGRDVRQVYGSLLA